MTASKPETALAGKAIAQTGAGGSRSDSPHPTGTDVGSALRSAFAATVEERVPDAMLDLLNRLN